MSKMAGNIKKSNEAMASETKVRTVASKREHSRSHNPTSFRLSPEILAKLEDLRAFERETTGKIPSATAVVIALIERAHAQAAG